MKHLTQRLFLCLSLVSVASFLFVPITFARTPYNALARKLPSNTTKGVFSETDKLQPNTQLSGTVWGKNGSTFLLKSPKDDSGYNVLFSKETTITLNGKKATSKNIVKGVAVTVMGTLDLSTYTLKAKQVELGKVVASKEKPINDSVESSLTSTSSETPNPISGSTKAKPSVKTITHTLKQGSRGDDVMLLQEKLAEQGYLSKNGVTGYYGAQTTKAVAAFQKKHKLSPVGSVGTKTIKLLNE